MTTMNLSGDLMHPHAKAKSTMLEKKAARGRESSDSPTFLRPASHMPDDDDDRTEVRFDIDREMVSTRYGTDAGTDGPSNSSIVVAAIQTELSHSMYPLQNIRCQILGAELVLTGEVCRYYYIQLALQKVMRLSGGLKICNRIKVVLAKVEKTG